MIVLDDGDGGVTRKHPDTRPDNQLAQVSSSFLLIKVLLLLSFLFPIPLLLLLKLKFITSFLNMISLYFVSVQIEKEEPVQWLPSFKLIFKILNLTLRS